MRHGQCDKTYTGGYNDKRLTEKGTLQVYASCDFLIDNNIRINKIISSDIVRAVESGNIIVSQMKKNIGVNDIFRGVDKGEYTGLVKGSKKWSTMQEMKPKKVNVAYLFGESLLDLYERVKSNLDYILSLDNCLVITHREFINVLYFILYDIELNMDKKMFGVGHASIHQCDGVGIRRIYKPKIRTKL